MKVDLNQVLANFDGVVLRDGEKLATLGRICGNAMMAAPPDDRSSGELKHKRFKIAEKCFKGGEVELEAEDIALIKEWVGKAFNPMVVGQTYEMLEGSRIGLTLDEAEEHIKAEKAEVEA